MTGDQLSLTTRHMTLEEIGEDFASSYDEMIIQLDREQAMDEAVLDDEVRLEPEFFPLARVDDGSDDSWERL